MTLKDAPWEEQDTAGSPWLPGVSPRDGLCEEQDTAGSYRTLLCPTAPEVSHTGIVPVKNRTLLGPHSSLGVTQGLLFELSVWFVCDFLPQQHHKPTPFITQP